MIQVKVTNEVNGRQFGANFETEEEAEAWVAKQKAKTSWGKNEHDVVVDVKEAPNARAIFKEDRTLTDTVEQEGFDPVLDEESGEVLYFEKTQYVYTIPCEYTVTISEYVDVNAKKNERDRILKATDWLFVSDNPVPSTYRVFYKNYRQQLRDLDLASSAAIESFENFLRRTAPEEFLEGGESAAIIKKFNAYL